MNRILIVEDDTSQRKALSHLLRSHTLDVEEAASGEEAFDMVQASDFDLVLLDEVMPNMSGMEVLIKIKKLKAKVRVIIITAFPTIDAAVAAIKKGASNYLSKPLDMDKLIVSIRRALEELKFQVSPSMADLDVTFGSLSHRTRRNIITLLHHNSEMHLMEMVRSLDIEEVISNRFFARAKNSGRFFEFAPCSLHKFINNG